MLQATSNRAYVRSLRHFRKLREEKTIRLQLSFDLSVENVGG